MQISIVNKSPYALPEYQTEGAAGLDIRANITESIFLKPLERTLVPTGLYIALPKNFEAQIRPRSGLAYKYGITVLNAPGTIDSDYRGEIKVLLVNLSHDTYEIKPGERIAQLVVAKHETIQWQPVAFLDETSRGEGGYGSTGHH